MAVQNSTVAPSAPTSSPLSPADALAHEMASHVRTVVVPVQETPTLPTDPAARRRFIQQRQW
ncbi:hypothetical protein ABZ401_19170 [Streptomyces sp. NPDC005892]|uniref:hypothetical protein n=1 Tax=Streptomyces sp. NPDC005892 TaxID=3155593 RepID=UPI0033FA62F8